jgi:lipopolysaccharide transport system ATP-binding protein
LLRIIGQLPFVPERLSKRCNTASQGSFRTFYALRDVSLDIRQNETVGIIGRNGSGKSTLLQLIAGTLTPTRGTVQVHGRVAALLELGSGFNPEFTGRENVYVNAAILGLSQEEIDRRYSDIAAFANIGDFIEQPVKIYSSGMYVRLAFAVAINVDADILIIDEALAVGDEAFQRKCFSRIRAFQDGGGTILFVSHSAASVVELCSRAVLIDQGELIEAGPPKSVVSKYHKLIYAPPEKIARLREEFRGGDREGPPSPSAIRATPDGGDEEQTFYDPHLLPQSTLAYESRGAVIESPRIATLSGRPVNVVLHGQEYVYEYSVRFPETCFDVRFGMLIKTVRGLELGGAASALPDQALECVEAGSRCTVRFRFRCLMAPGTYFLNAGVMGTVEGAQTFLHRLIDAVMLRVQPDAEARATGLVDFGVVPEVSMEAPTAPTTLAAAGLAASTKSAQ